MKWFSFNGKRSDTNPQLFITSINRPIMPSVQVDSVKVGKRAGAHLLKSTIGTLEITFNIYIMAENDEELRKKARDIAVNFYTEEEAELTLSDEPDIFYQAKLSGNTDFDTIAATGTGALTFICGDPYGYKTTEENQVLETAADTVTEIYNDGAPTYPRLRVVPTAATSNIRIDNDTNTEHMLLIGNFQAWEQIIIDHETNSVYYETTGERLLYTLDLSSDFFRLESGANQLKHNGNLSIRIYWRERFL